MKRVVKICKWGGISLLALVAVLALVVGVRSRRTFEAPYPSLHVPSDAAAIERGRYLAYGPAHCVDCHGDPALAANREPTQAIALSGGHEFNLPVGVFRAANLTSDAETGIGGLRDDQIARALRHGVGRSGRALVPFMPFNNLSDDDLGALIAFLRTQQPVKNQVEQFAPNILGRVVAAFVLEPVGPSGAPPQTVKPETTATYGKYLAHSVANCVGCHTERDLRTGAAVGEPFAGGLTLPSETVQGLTFTSPNLTPDPKTGRITSWNEDVFVARFQTGRGAEGSPMPWKSFGNMSETDLRALYRYLITVPAVHNDTGDSVRATAVAAN